MRIDQLTVTNFRRFDHKTLDFSPNFNVLIGDNGSGKTAVLEALKIALGAYLAVFNGRFERIVARDIRLIPGGTDEQPTAEAAYPVVVEAIGEADGKQIRWRRDVSMGTSNRGNTVAVRGAARQLIRQIQTGPDPTFPVIAYYPARRLWPQGISNEDLVVFINTDAVNQQKHYTTDSRDSTPDRAPSRLKAYESALSAHIGSKAVTDWFRRLTLSELQRGKPNQTLAAVRAAALQCLPVWDEFYYDVQREALVVQKQAEILPVNLLSDGQRSLLFLALDIAYRCALLNPHLRDHAARDTPGVVLIDEIDLHLHPHWQRRIVDELRTVFPKIQFIATTHSPLIVQSLRAGELIDLGPQVDEEPEKYVGKSPEDILENVMNEEMPQRSRRSLEMIAVAEKYYDLLSQAPEHPDLPKLRQRLDVLMEPYEEDEAYIAALRLERRAAGIDDKQLANEAPAV